MQESKNTVAAIPRFLTINQVARLGIVTEHYLRQGVKQGKIPGFWSGSRFYVNVKKLMRQLEAE